MGGFSVSDRSKKRGRLPAGLDEIAELQGGMGWTIGKTNSGLCGEPSRGTAVP
jgi:hypothetical protein